MQTTTIRRASLGVVIALAMTTAACEPRLLTSDQTAKTPLQVQPTTQATKPTVAPTTASTGPTTAPTESDPTVGPTTLPPTIPTAVPTVVPTTRATTVPTTAPPTKAVPDPVAGPGVPPGVPPGTTLTAHRGDLTITKPGTVVANKEIFGRVSIKAPNVTIKNSRIRAQKPTKNGVVSSKENGVVIENTEILSDHDNTDVNGIMGSGFTLKNVQIRHVVDQVHIHGAGNVTISDSWLHGNIHWEKDPNWGGKPTHDDNIQVVSGSNIVVEGTRIEDSRNAAIMLGQSSGKISDVTLRDNVIGGGACSVNIAPKNHGPLSAISIVDNTFTRTQTKNPGCAVIAPSSSKPLLQGNTWATGGEVRLSQG